ncbi:MAG: cation transporter, partial [Bacteroidales bacterium]|nr:cation transporter [Bacteroidales bacterium]
MSIKKITLALACLLFVTALQAQNSGKNQSVIFQTNGTCQSCKNKIENNIAYEKGVKDVNFDLATSKVRITYNPKKTDPQKLQAAIRNLGYTAEPDSPDCKKNAAGTAAVAGTTSKANPATIRKT